MTDWSVNGFLNIRRKSLKNEVGLKNKPLINGRIACNAPIVADRFEISSFL
jgi:hypothetical protein